MTWISAEKERSAHFHTVLHPNLVIQTDLTPAEIVFVIFLGINNLNRAGIKAYCVGVVLEKKFVGFPLTRIMPWYPSSTLCFHLSRCCHPLVERDWLSQGFA